MFYSTREYGLYETPGREFPQYPGQLKHIVVLSQAYPQGIDSHTIYNVTPWAAFVF